jgi:hypothetical protein
MNLLLIKARNIFSLEHIRSTITGYNKGGMTMNGIKRQIKLSTIHLFITFLICVFSLLIFACTSTNKKEMTTLNNVTDQIGKKDESDVAKTGDDQKIECRTDAKTGTNFKKKICATKAEWAIKDSKNKELKDRFYRSVNDNSGLAGSGSD